MTIQKKRHMYPDWIRWVFWFVVVLGFTSPHLIPSHSKARWPATEGIESRWCLWCLGGRGWWPTHHTHRSPHPHRWWWRRLTPDACNHPPTSRGRSWRRGGWIPERIPPLQLQRVGVSQKDPTYQATHREQHQLLSLLRWRDRDSSHSSPGQEETKPVVRLAEFRLSVTTQRLRVGRKCGRLDRSSSQGLVDGGSGVARLWAELHYPYWLLRQSNFLISPYYIETQ